MKWFKHFTRAHEDRAIEKLIAEFGVDGYGLYFYCLEIIAGTVESDNLTFELEPDAEILARRLSMDTVKVEKIMHKCVEMGLFEISDIGRITCLKMGTFLDRASSSNPEVRKIIALRESRKITENHSGCDQIRLDEIRLDENRIKKEPRAKCYTVYGKLENVKLTDEEHSKLVAEYGDDVARDYIDRLSIWMPNASRRVKSCYATLLNWLRRDKVPTQKRLLTCDYCGATLSDGICGNKDCSQYQ